MTGTLLAVAAVGAAILLVVGRRAGLGRAGGWAGLLVIGQAASLRWIEAGPVVRYQHYAPPDRWVADPLALVLFATEGVLVAVGLWRARDVWMPWARKAGAPRLAAIGLVLFGLAAVPSRDLLRYAVELPLAFVVQLVHLSAVLLAVAAVPTPRLAEIRRRWTTAGAGPARGADEPWWRPDRVALAGALFAAAAAAAMAFFVYQRHPHVPDEVAYLYHARYLARGWIEMPAPPVLPAFELDLMTYEATRWFSPVPPGWPAVLALGARAGVPWAVNPILGGVGVLLCFGVARRLYGRAVARGAALLLAVSPWYLFLAMSLMTHTSSLVAALVAAWALLRWRGGDGLAWAAVSGGALGLVGLIRPLEAVATGLVLLIGLVVGRRARELIPAGAVFGVAAAVVSSLVLPYNAHLTGSPTQFPIMTYTDALYGPGTNALGFGPDRGLGWGLDPFPGHGVPDVVVNTILNGAAVNTELFGWATGSLVAVLLFATFGRRRPADLAMGAAVGIVIGLHAFYWFAGGPDFGARYWFLIIVPLVVLSARGLESAGGTQSAGGVEAAARLGMAAALLSIAALLCFVPWRAFDKYVDYRGMRPDVRRIAEREGFGRSLILVRGERHPDYASAAVYNPLDLRADAPVYAWDRGPEVRAALRRAFPDRPVWILEGPSLTGDGYRVVARP